MNRYARQLILPEVGEAGQVRLALAHVLVIGAGGLGCPALQYLAGAGVGTITIIDPDLVDESNLHRQTLYGASSIGKSKAEVAKQVLNDLNGEISITALFEAFEPANAPGLIAGADIVLDCADSFAATYIASDVCKLQEIPFISASVTGMTGYVGGYCGGAPSVRAVFPDLPETLASCATAGVLGPVVGILGSMQAQMALAVLLGLDPSPLGRLVTVDARTFTFGGFRFDGANEPAGETPGFISVKDISARDHVVELRTVAETVYAVTPCASRVSIEDFSTYSARPDAPDQRLVLCCRSGLRAWQAARMARASWPGPISLVAAGEGTGGSQTFETGDNS